MAIKKHAMTKEGAIVAITRSQFSKLNEGKQLSGIQKSFIDLYMAQTDKRIREAYYAEFETELEIVEYK